MDARHYQVDAVNAAFTFFDNSSPGDNPLIVMPTGSGKSVVVALFIQEVFKRYGPQRIIVLTHVKELIEQNYEKLQQVAPDIDAGINSASVGRRDTEHAVLFAGIQSVYKKALELDAFKVMIIDECHLVSRKNESMYQTFLQQQRLKNPNLRVVGLTATHYRLDSGLLTEGDNRIFTDVCYELTIDALIPEYLSPLVSKGGLEQVDFSDVRTQMGEYVDKDVETAFLPVLNNVLAEIISYGKTRSNWLIFTPTVVLAHKVAERLQASSINAEALDGSMKKEQRNEIIDGYKFGITQCLVSVGVLTTGFDAPQTDLIAILIATKSPGRLVQICGRGMRQAPGKENCLVLDYGRNIERHGAINTIRPKRKTNTATRKTEIVIDGQPTRECPQCETVLSVFEKTCPNCGYKWPLIDINIDEVASNADIIQDKALISPIEIIDWCFARHDKAGKPSSIRVSYFDNGGYLCSEWVCLWHQGFAKKKALEWLQQHIIEPDDLTDFDEAGYFENVDKALQLFDDVNLAFWRMPSILNCKKPAKYWEIVSREFNTTGVTNE